MQEAAIVARQVIIMFMMMAVGLILSKTGLIQEKGVPTLNSLAVYIAGPAIMIRSFDMPFSAEKAASLLVCVLLSAAVMSIACVAAFFWPKASHMEQYAMIFNNCGFVGIPLTQAILGLEAVFYMSILMAVWTIFCWTYGIWLLTGRRDLMSLQKIVTNPVVVAIGIGLIVFLLPVELPEGISQPLTYLGDLNTPLGMLILGNSLSKADFHGIWKRKALWTAAAGRLLVIPLLTLLALSLVSPQWNEIRMVMMIAASTPCGAMMVMLSNMFGKDVKEASLIVSFSTLASIVTIPFVLSLMSLLWT